MSTDQEQTRLVMLQGPQPDRFFGLSEAEISVGREMQNQIVIGDPEVSRRHALLRQTRDGYTIEDLGSTNGTFVNGARIIRAIPLADGDRISLGETIQLVYQRALPARDRTILAGAGRVTPSSGESRLPAEPDAEIEAPVEPPVEAGLPAPPMPIEPVELYDAEVLEPPPPFDEPPAAGTEKEPPAEEGPPPPPEAPFEGQHEVRPAPPSFEPLRPARYEEPREMPPPPPYQPPRPPVREPGPSFRQTQRQEPPPPPYQEPPPPPYYEEYEPAPPQPRSKRKRTLLIGCGCLLLLLACASVVGLGYLIWNAPYEFFQDPIRNLDRLFEILTMLLVLP